MSLLSQVLTGHCELLLLGWPFAIYLLARLGHGYHVTRRIPPFIVLGKEASKLVILALACQSFDAVLASREQAIFADVSQRDLALTFPWLWLRLWVLTCDVHHACDWMLIMKAAAPSTRIARRLLKTPTRSSFFMSRSGNRRIFTVPRRRQVS